ncbi:hypothetical protein CC1G_06160 [Coprinopsis cinerea okayama7|uniref:DUF6533 domain-containing protein n=1 Tax=Coprinopsis cinerea (strain Okayama-7 / 130 / ATCC MYA-4618 / FGSC 9003) TaxID=240176 RepID=A8PAD7_COPC7|nr:hypothetical protein CC1G_06160 [Coprinopsis cinerea okayama7\|eukprot:XP_001839970.2 hypothetical protein CC1G_06160 [Coprinopsis cinerea okayama7\
MAFVYYICDWAHTFEWEVAYMWEKGNWSLIKVAYFLARYTGLVDWPLIFIYNHASELTPKECNTLFYAAILIGLGGSGFGETLMFLRVYVLSGCSKKMGLYLVFHFYVTLPRNDIYVLDSLPEVVEGVLDYVSMASANVKGNTLDPRRFEDERDREEEFAYARE